MWKTTNYKGEVVTWYSEEEYTILEQENQEAKEIIAELEHKLEDIADLYDDSEHAKQVKKIIQRED